MSKFKVGDRVDTKGNYSFDPGRGTVVKADDDDLYFVEIDGEEGPGCDPGWAYNGHHLVAVAPATATLTIETGKFYKTRDGRKVGPMERYAEFGEPGWQTVSRAGDFGGKLWIDDGRRYFQSDRGGPSDLIAEWVDEPATPAPTTTFPHDIYLPFPQVGDAVLIPGVISAINQSPRGTNYNIVFETQNRRMSLHFLDEDFILDECGDDGDCPCANDNGPVPSTDTAKAFDALGDWLRAVAIDPSAAFRSNKEAA